MKRTFTLALAALCGGLASCSTTGSTVTVSPAGGQPVSFVTGKNVQQTAKTAALAAAAWYLLQLAPRSAPSK